MHHPPTHSTRRQALVWLAGVSTASLVKANAPGQSNDPFWQAARQGGHVLLMRHAATVPGTGDPPNFRLGDCSTQRNLSDTGRLDARHLGERLTREGVKLHAVYSSAWCRCVDTAVLAFDAQGHPHQVWPALNSFFQGQGDGARQTREVIDRLGRLPAGQTWALVTHQVNITALTGEYPAMGEVFLVRPVPNAQGRLPVVARWRSGSS